MQTSVRLGPGQSQQPEPDEIRRELSSVLGSTIFRASRRCHDFLEYVVTKTLAGKADELKERNLAVWVFGRKADADLGDDSIVRVGAREVRKRLVQYYTGEGAADPVRIEVPAGSYVPVFRWSDIVPEPAPVPVPVFHPVPPVVDVPKTPPESRRWLPIAAAVLLTVAVAIAWMVLHPTPQPFDAFWAPALTHPGPVVLAMAHPIVYHPSSRANELDEAKNGKPALPLQRSIHVPPHLLTGSDFVPVLDQYVGFGDSVAASRLSVMLAQRGHEPRMRIASKLDFADLRDSSSVLIGGAYTNRWTLELSQKLRYRFAFTGSKPCILDSLSGKQWTLTDKSDNGHSTEDYILIGRLLHTETGSFVVIGAGLTQYGTEEVGRILSDPDALGPLLQKLPPTWRTQNLEVVLHSQVLGDAPTSPELTAYHVW